MPNPLTHTTVPRHTLVNALNIAAEQYDADWVAMEHVQPRLAEQFQRQAAKARQLAEQIEQATTLTLTD